MRRTLGWMLATAVLLCGGAAVTGGLDETYGHAGGETYGSELDETYGHVGNETYGSELDETYG